MDIKKSLCHDITSGKVDQEEVVSDIFYSSILFPNLPPEVMRINSLITWSNGGYEVAPHSRSPHQRRDPFGSRGRNSC